MTGRTIFPSAVEVVRQQPLVSTTLVVLGLVGSVLGLVQPALTGRLVEGFGAGGGLWYPALALGLVFCASAIVGGVTSYVSARITENGVVGIREAAVKRVLGASVQTLTEVSSSATASRVVNDPPLLIQGPVSVLTGAPAAALSCVGAALACVGLMPSAFLGAMVCSLAALLLTAVLGRRVRDRRIRVQDSLSEFSGDLQTVLESITAIRHYSVMSFFEGDLTKALRDLRKRSLSLAGTHALVSPLTSLTLNAALVVALILAASDVAQGRSTLAGLVSFVMYFQVATNGLQQLLTVYVSLQEGQAGRERMRELDRSLGRDRARDATVLVPAATSDPGKDVGETISFQDVHFSYDENTVLNGISFSLPSGATTAVVGPSGSGKTTLLNLIEGFLEPDAGTVDGLGGRQSRGRTGFVDQAATVIKGSIADNVRFRRQGITDDQVCSVLKHVGLPQYANDEAMHAPVQPRGASLSGGERQRLALARALVGGADTLVLDEPTSNVDGALERHMLDAIEELAPHATVVVVAHRPATVRRADHLIFLDKGTVKEEGTPQECLNRSQGLREVLGEWETGQ